MDTDRSRSNCALWSIKWCDKGCMWKSACPRRWAWKGRGSVALSLLFVSSEKMLWTAPMPKARAGRVFAVMLPCHTVSEAFAEGILKYSSLTFLSQWTPPMSYPFTYRSCFSLNSKPVNHQLDTAGETGSGRVWSPCRTPGWELACLAVTFLAFPPFLLLFPVLSSCFLGSLIRVWASSWKVNGMSGRQSKSCFCRTNWQCSPGSGGGGPEHLLRVQWTHCIIEPSLLLWLVESSRGERGEFLVSHCFPIMLLFF